MKTPPDCSEYRQFKTLQALPTEAERAAYIAEYILPLPRFIPEDLKVQRHGPAWKQMIGKANCHICHKPLRDAMSIKVKIGISDCTPRIEQATGIPRAQWELMPGNWLEMVWSQYNRYGFYIDDYAYKVTAMHRFGQYAFFTLETPRYVYVYDGQYYVLYTADNARCLYYDLINRSKPGGNSGNVETPNN